MLYKQTLHYKYDMCIIKSLSISESNKNSNFHFLSSSEAYIYVTLSSNIAFTSQILDDCVF